MAATSRRTVLFLGTQEALLRTAVSEFNTLTNRMGLPWSASHHALAEGAGPTLPGSVIEAATRVVLLNLPVPAEALATTFPGGPERVENWPIPSGAELAAKLSSEVNDLVARILSGRKRGEHVPPPPPPEPAKRDPVKKVHTVRVGWETAGRRGKGVTTIWELPLNAEQIKELAASLKQRCGTGGTVKDGKIEIQGDQRDRVIAELEKMGYKVKRSGG